ncbi:RtcB family protein [candidate division KSB1 bacterium]
MQSQKLEIKRVNENLWEIPRQGGMRVPGRIIADDRLMQDIHLDQSLSQVANVAHLPGIIDASYAMPDIHWGYGFPIGGVAAMDINEGVISPGGVGYDINCGVRLMNTALFKNDVLPKVRGIVNALYAAIPTGVGSESKIRLSFDEEKRVLREGAGWAVSRGYGTETDLERIEEKGCLKGADPSAVSNRTLERGRSQIGTLGSGNHFLEIGYVDEVYDKKIADSLGLYENGITVSIHTGSRGFGYQVCDESIKVMMKCLNKYDINVPDRQLACAPINSSEGQRYISAMFAAANYAWANRQTIMHWTRQILSNVLGISQSSLKMNLIYDVSHNIAKFEEYIVKGKTRKVCVHRKGATRALPPGHKNTPEVYKGVGQPVLIPGDMGRYSYVLVGTQKAVEVTFGSTCHGAGRVMSRKMAVKKSKGRAIHKELENKGIYVQSKGYRTIQEEMPDAYKDVKNVVDVVHNAGISKKVVRLRPVGVIKG